MGRPVVNWVCASAIGGVGGGMSDGQIGVQLTEKYRGMSERLPLRE